MILLLSISGFAALLVLIYLNKHLDFVPNEDVGSLIAYIIVLGVPLVLGFILLKLGWKL